jgi:5'-3' exoribonuclease 2
MPMLGEETTVEHEVPDFTSNVTRITTCTIQTLSKIGTYAASSGGSQVALLNVSWKGVVSLLQLGKGLIEVKLSVSDIISTLISLVIESLRVAADTWCMSLQEVIGISEARRAFLPIKFFLINAVRICTVYPAEALTIYRGIIRCTLVISSSSILFSKDPLLKAANEALVELLEPSSFLLLDTLMKSSEVRLESKCQLVQYLLENEADNPTQMGQDGQKEMNLASLGCIFSVDPDGDNRNRALLPAEFIVFLHLLNISPDLKEEVVIELSKRLPALLNILTLEDVYSFVLGCQIPTFYGADHPPVVVWQPVYTFVIQALKTYMIAAAASTVAWNELEAFLLESLFHPHFLCLEILTELWCFFVRHADNETSSYLINQLFLLLKTIASPEKVLAPLSALRKVAHASCVILSYASCATIDQIYTCLLNDQNSSESSVLHLALLMEGFPFDSLSAGVKAHAVNKLFTSFAGYLQSYLKNPGAIDLPTSSPGVIGLPVHALASALQRW